MKGNVLIGPHQRNLILGSVDRFLKAVYQLVLGLQLHSLVLQLLLKSFDLQSVAVVALNQVGYQLSPHVQNLDFQQLQ